MIAAARSACAALLLACAALAAPACIGEGEFHCTRHDQCGGSGNLCEPDGHCSRPDTTCGSDRRYVALAGAMSNACVTQACASDPVIALRAGSTHACLLRQQGGVECWGNNADGQLGDGTFTPRSEATPVAGLRPATAIAAGDRHTCAVAGGSVYCWGANTDGQLGDGARTPHPVPLTVAGISNARDIAAGSDATCAVEADGTALCWGNNSHGQLGDGTGLARTEPVNVFAFTGTRSIAGHWQHFCAVRGDETLWCWETTTRGRSATARTSISPSRSRSRR